jgi:multidrug resistance protein MdtO
VASVAQSLPASPQPFSWFREFLKQELAPYPGRAATVARMVLAATVIMTISMAFRIPYGFQGAVYALFITHESPRATLQSGRTILIVTALSVAYVLAGAYFVISVPLLHFLWNIGSFFLAFYAISAVTNYGASIVFAIVISVAVPIWDRQVSAETNVEDTLRLALSALVGIVVTAAVELVCRRMRPGDEIVLPLAARLAAVHSLFVCYADGRPLDEATETAIIRFGTLGTSRLRPLLRRSDYSPQYRTQMNAVTVLVGRLLDIAATMTELRVPGSGADRTRLQALAEAVQSLRADLVNRRIPSPIQFDTHDETGSGVPMLRDLEDTLALIPQAFADSKSMDYAALSEDQPRQRLIAPDVFSNREHFRFALKGCLAASACYMLYNFIAWPGISTSVSTCLLTGLTTIGASRQKQILRLTGALAGGVVIGMGSQIFVLPHIDSIAGFAVLFALVTAVASWIATSSPRLSYFGVQVAFAFYLINLQEFAFQTSLSIARDRVVGVLVGLVAMWLVFDRLWGRSAMVEMRRTFIANLRLLAQYAREPLSNDLKVAVERSFSLRETINNSLDQVRSLADGVLFEFGPTRQQGLVLRDRFRHWQPRLRMIFVTQIALWKYRARVPGFEVPEAVAGAQKEFDERLAGMLDGIAAWMEARPPAESQDLAGAADRLARTIQASSSGASPEPFAPRLETVLSLSRRIASLAISLDQEIRFGIQSS